MKAIFVPSGDQAGYACDTPLADKLVSGATPEPSAFAVHMLNTLFGFRASAPFSAPTDKKASLVLSGDQMGCWLVQEPSGSVTVSLVTGVAVPLPFITHTLKAPLTFTPSLPSRAADEANASFLPSGDQASCQLTIPLAVRRVSGAALLPSAFIIQILLAVPAASLPSRARVETNAIFLPSGDQMGSVESAPLAVSCVRGATPDPSLFPVQILVAGFALLLPLRAPVELKATVRTAGAFIRELLPPQLLINNDSKMMDMDVDKDDQTDFVRDISGKFTPGCRHS